MRELKFRAWDRRIKQFCHIELLIGCMTMPEMIIADLEFWQQYTGTKDKNKIEIYEGDIITHEVNDMIGVVTWGLYGFVIETLDRKEIIADLSEYDYDPEIIGNVYENPELLNES